MTKVLELLASKKVIFWDFDGVIKESLQVKADAYASLVSEFGEDISNRVRQHHNMNGGVSRFEKIPLYLTWGGLEPTHALSSEYEARFADTVVDGVLACSWVPGVKEYLKTHHSDQDFIIVTATPQQEIEQILRELKISTLFRKVFGAPIKKSDSIRKVLAQMELSPSDALMIGDADTDFQAARDCGVEFVLRQTEQNKDLQSHFSGVQFQELPL